MRRALPTALAAGLALAALAGCEKFEFLPDDPVPPIRTQVLMHRGSGLLADPPPNTLASMLYGAALLDGVEMDLEITSDDVAWLGHDNEVYDCAGTTLLGCFQELSDAEIEAVATCNGVRRYDRLEHVLTEMGKAYPGKAYSLDIKGQFCQALGEDGVKAKAVKLAEEVDRIVRASGLGGRVMTESSQDSFTERLIALGTPVYPLVVSLGDVDGPLTAAAALGATGISMKYDPADPTIEPITASLVKGIHQKGLRIVAWIVDGEAHAQYVWSTGVDGIQTNDGNFYSYLPVIP